jgi:hypothetical protein
MGEENIKENQKDHECGCSNAFSPCIFPPCPKCDAGYLLPFSRGEDVFEKWKCNECSYVIEKR